jgi:hypothetical protein
MEEKVVGLNKKLICIASQYSGVEILLDSGFFLDKNNNKLFGGFNGLVNKGVFDVHYDKKSCYQFTQTFNGWDFKNNKKLKLNFSSFEHEASFKYMEDSRGKSSEWYLTEKDYDNSKLLDRRISKKKYNQIYGFEGYEYIRNDLESHDHPQSVRFFYNDNTYDFFEEVRKGKKNILVYEQTTGDYTNRIRKYLKDLSDNKYDNSLFPKKYKMRYKTRKKLADKTPSVFFNQTTVALRTIPETVRHWNTIIKSCCYPYRNY